MEPNTHLGAGMDAARCSMDPLPSANEEAGMIVEAATIIGYESNFVALALPLARLAAHLLHRLCNLGHTLEVEAGKMAATGINRK